MDLDQQNSENLPKNLKQFDKVTPTQDQENLLELETQQELDLSVTENLLGEDEVSLSKFGIPSLRPMTLASVMLLKKANSKLIAGVNLDELGDGILHECGVFILAHTLSNREFLRLVKEDELELACLDVLAKVVVSDSSEFAQAIVSIIQKSTNTQVSVEVDSNEEVLEGND